VETGPGFKGGKAQGHSQRKLQNPACAEPVVMVMQRQPSLPIYDS
jgi:hypothetical protein